MAPQYKQPNSINIHSMLFLLLNPIANISKKKGYKFLDFENTPKSDIVAKFFNIWICILFYEEFSYGVQRKDPPVITEENINKNIRKLAIYTPPLIFNCGKNIRGFLKYDPRIISLEKTAFTELIKIFPIDTTKEISIPISNEEYLYAYVVYKISMQQIKYLQNAKQKRNTKCAENIENLNHVSNKFIILPTFFAYLFDSGVQCLPASSDLFNTISRFLFNEYFTVLCSMEPCSLRELLIVEDMIFLLKSSCNLFAYICTLSTNSLKGYSTKFPFILTRPTILFVFLDLIGTLYNELYYPYDSLSHVLRLPHSMQTIALPVEKARKQDCFRFLIKLFEELYLKAALINENQLVAVFQEYVHRTLATQTMDSMAHFGISFFQNLYANYKNYDPGAMEKQSFNYLQNLETFNLHVESLIAKRIFIYKKL